MRARATSCAIAALAALPFAGAAIGQRQPAAPLPAPLVYLRAVEPSILQEMRYATADNFTGKPLPGYAAPECVLLASVAAALARVQRDLASHDLSLKVYDCYRPRRAVAAVHAWMKEGPDDVRSRQFHPRIDRTRLHEHGYVAAVSGHSQGNSVDLTLVLSTPVLSSGGAAVVANAACHQSPPEQTAYPSLDMGTGFDCFDARSHRQATGLTLAQRDLRKTLHDAMISRGFRGYSKEWWHFSFATNEGGGISFDVPVTAYRP